MKSIRIKNLRSLHDTGEMEIKPINVLVGLNSSGKSTFLRFFPLMKQSLRRKVNGPILWSGEDDDYVDFGSFNEALNNNAKEKKISFKFSLKMNIVNEYSFFYDIKNQSNYEDSDVDIEISLSKCENDIFDYISELLINILDYKLLVEIGDNRNVKGVKINDKYYNMNLKENDKEVFISKLIEGDFSSPFEIKLDILKLSALKYIKDDGVIEGLDNIENMLYRQRIMDYLFLKKVVRADVESQESIILNTPRRFYEYCSNIENVKNLNADFNNILMMYQIPKIYNIISQYLSMYFRNIYYIAPVRATAERYYRLRNTAVDEVDCRGKNLAIFLNSLNDGLFKKFQEWTNENLGFKVVKTSSEGHVSLKILKKNSKEPINLSDTGFGYSQILPIITQLWYITMKKQELFISNVGLRGIRSFNNILIPITITIEQPELHLHPSLQAKLVDVIVKVLKNTKKEKKEINFVIETHSETIINRLGNLIYKEKIKNEEVAIFIFDKDSGKNDTSIDFGKFDEEGYLENWPIGFFEPEEVL